MHDDTGDRPWDLTPLARMQQLYADAGLELVGIEDYPPMDRARTGAPGADEETEWFCEQIRNMGTLGIPMLCYNWMPGAQLGAHEHDRPRPRRRLGDGVPRRRPAGRPAP